MHRDYRLFLEDIIESIQRIRDYTKGMDEKSFSKDNKTQDAVIRNLEIIGEASRSIPESIRLQITEIEWKKIIGMRNILIHQYFGINVAILWDIVIHKLDDLYDVCQRLVEE